MFFDQLLISIKKRDINKWYKQIDIIEQAVRIFNSIENDDIKREFLILLKEHIKIGDVLVWFSSIDLIQKSIETF